MTKKILEDYEGEVRKDQQGQVGGARKSAGRPKGSQNKTLNRQMPETTNDGLEGLVELLREVREKIRRAIERDDPREEGFIKQLVLLRGSILRQLLPYRFAKAPTETKYEASKPEAKNPVSVRLNLKKKDDA